MKGKTIRVKSHFRNFKAASLSSREQKMLEDVVSKTSIAQKQIPREGYKVLSMALYHTDTGRLYGKKGLEINPVRYDKVKDLIKVGKIEAKPTYGSFFKKKKTGWVPLHMPGGTKLKFSKKELEEGEIFGSSPYAIVNTSKRKYVRDSEGEVVKLEFPIQAQKMIENKLGNSKAFKIVKVKQ